jgi:hypothetical protein
MQEENELDDIIMESQIHDLEGVSWNAVCS